MVYILLALGVIQILSYGCNSKRVVPKGGIEIGIDSVFLNYYKDKKSYDPMYIFFHFSLKNIGKDTVSVNLPWSEFDKPLKESGEIFGVYGNDTVKFYSGSFTPQSFLIYPGEIKKVDFQYGSCNELLNFYEERFKEKFNRKQDFMYDLASKSRLVFKLKGVNYTDSSVKREIIFRDPKDVDEHTWK